MFAKSNKVNIGVSVSLGVGLEMIVVDPGKKKILKYANRPLEYNSSTREIGNIEQFKAMVNELYRELYIDPAKSNVVINLPNVYTAHVYLPMTLDDESVTTAVISEVEQNYLFKKNTPVVSWAEINSNDVTENRYILYSAMQESQVDAVKAVFAEMGATVVAVESSYSSLLKTLEFTGLAKDFADDGRTWNILLVTSNSYAVFSMSNHTVLEYFEDPIAIKSFSQDEVYVAISQAAADVLARFSSERLMVISETDDVSAEILAVQMKRSEEVLFLECNKFSKMPIMNIDFSILPNYVQAITPEVIGAAIYKAQQFSLSLNFLTTTEFKSPDLITLELFGTEYELTKEKLTAIVMVIVLAVCGLGYLAGFAAGQLAASYDTKKTELDTEQTELNTELSKLQGSDSKIDIYTATNMIKDTLTQKVSYFNAVGADIPSKVWLKSFFAGDSRDIAIKGETLSVDDVYVFFRSLKSQVKNSDLVLSKLSVDDKGGLIDIENSSNAVYSFELTNPAYIAAIQAKAAAAAAALDPNNPDAAAQSAPAPAPSPEDMPDNGGSSPAIPKLQDLPTMN